MKALKYLSFVGKVAGLVSALNVIPFVDLTVGVVVFAVASLLKDAVTASATCWTTANPTPASMADRSPNENAPGWLALSGAFCWGARPSPPTPPGSA